MSATWLLTIRSPWQEPRKHTLRAGKTTLGRKPDNDIVIADDSASRVHAEIEYDPDTETVTIRDLDSTNGTYVNRERLVHAQRLRSEDQIRIGQHLLTISQRITASPRAIQRGLPGTQPLTRDLVLESVDQHALVLYEVAMRLNTILDLDSALAEVSRLAQVAIGADKCEVIPASRFSQLSELGFPTSIARQAIEQQEVVFIPDLTAAFSAPGQSALLLRIRSVLCVPGMLGDEVVALTYVYRTGPEALPFDQHDLQLAVAISHQAALTIQRSQLVEQTDQLNQLTIVDGLTGLHNRRHFLKLAEGQLQPARENQRPLAVMLLDIDNLRHVNTAYGPAIGDEVLRAVAQAFRAGLAESHLLARYGDDEFAALLSDCDLPTAERLSRRIRERIAMLTITTPAGPLQFTVSSGCAVLGDPPADLAALLEHAASALQAAKRWRALSRAMRPA